MFSTGFCICEQEKFSFTPQENIWFYEVRDKIRCHNKIRRDSKTERTEIFEVLQLPFLPKQVRYPTHNFKN